MLISVEIEQVMKFFGWKKIPREWQWTFLHFIAHVKEIVENEQVWLNRIVRTNAKFVCESKTVFWTDSYTFAALGGSVEK